MLKDKLDVRKDLAIHLFEKGYLITNKQINDLDVFPFYGNWNETKVGSYYFYVHKNAKLFLYQNEGLNCFLVGHAYNPFSMEIDEVNILETIADKYSSGKWLDELNELTGVFVLGIIENDKITISLDASGMQYGCYGKVNGDIYITSHMRLIGDICNLKTTDYVERLTNYKWYSFMMGNYLPGDITCYDELKRIVPNTYVVYDKDFSVHRFYPCTEIKMCANEKEYDEVIDEACKIMQNTMELIPKKWSRPAISLTGGIDSNTTFAAANGNYDKYTTFSYISMYRESVDAEKAKEISDRFGVENKRYQVSENNEDYKDFELYKEILSHNDGDIGKRKDDDTRKKIVLIENDVCDVEVKSWISETIRAYAYKYFGRIKFPKVLSPREYTSLYKIFLGNRKLVKETDKYYKEFFENTDLIAHLYNYDHSDFFVWEMMHGGKCGLNIGTMKSCFDITIPYNNRKLLDILLRVPLEKRISDQLHLDMKKKMNKELFDMNIRVVNLNETDKRKKMANIYYTINSKIPF